MKNPQSIKEVNLTPESGKKYWRSGRPWEEEIIYFILVDRFQDSVIRTETVSKGFGTREELQSNCGGTLNGILNNLSYIQNLGCTAIWLSPVFENNPHSYHGYDIRNFLNIDPRFGTIDDLKNLISEAHQRQIKIFLDVVLNHSGDNWHYQSNKPSVYNKGVQYKFGGWNSEHFPVPIELRNPDYYHRKGCITRWDDYPETQEGDFFSLKKFKNDESGEGLALQEILLKTYCYWIKETDCDGFRMDAVKHLGELPSARFASNVKEYAKLLGKDEFFIFGEMAAHDELSSKFITPITSSREKRIYQGLDSILDFPLHFLLPKVIQGKSSVSKLKARYDSIQKIFEGSKGTNFQHVNFLDNHDQIEKSYKKRIAAELNEKQLIAALGILLFISGVPCIYYGTEQGLNGEGDSDVFVREAMFSLSDKSTSALNSQSKVYQELSKFIEIRKKNQELKYGRIFFPSNSGSEKIVNGGSELIVFTRCLFDQEIIVAYNPSLTEKRKIKLEVKSKESSLRYLFGRKGEVSLVSNLTGRKEMSTNYLEMELDPMEFLVLK